MRRHLHSENIGGRTEHWYLVDEDGKKSIGIQTVQDVEPILEANKTEFNSAPSDFRKGAFHKVASIPATVIEDACSKHHIPYQELAQGKTDRAQRIWNGLLNAREFRYFRTRPGRVDMK